MYLQPPSSKGSQKWSRRGLGHTCLSTPAGILTAVHDELTCILRNFKPSAKKQQKQGQQQLGADGAALAAMVDASWQV